MPVNENETQTPDRKNNRIVYIEPNDFEGRINNVPVTPDYTDYCIFFDLIAEVTSRMSYNQVAVAEKNSSTDKTYVISWMTYKAEENTENKKPNNWVSFMHGEDANEYKNKIKQNYLTTYYTDIHLNEIRKRNLYEGLGVESVNITYESYYTPTVKIRFIDVRGSSLFGREEILHKDDELLPGDSIWGGFFTLPYPKYKLMFKGFYGKEVTLHLTLLDWRANFNSSTGNFEIDATFIGYDFGLIADIPMAYLIAAPKCRYGGSGKAYWEKHKNDVAWQLSTKSGTMPPKTLQEIADKIREAVQVNEQQANTETAGQSSNGGSATLTETLNDSTKEEALKSLKQEFDYYAAEWINTKKYTWLHKINDKAVSQISFTKRESGNGFWYKDDNAKYPTVKDWQVYGDDVVNEAYKMYVQTDFFRYYARTDWKYNVKEHDVIKRNKRVLKEKIEEYKSLCPNSELFNDGACQDFVKKVTENKETEYKATDNEIERFWSFLQKEVISSTTSISTTNGNSSSTTPAIPDKQNIVDIVGFYPVIGDVFKLVYCHLETFMDMMYTCCETIQNQLKDGDRTIKKLGLKSNHEVDVVFSSNMGKDEKTEGIPPFPKVIVREKDKKNNEADEGEADTVETLEWVGNIKGKTVDWEEQKLVEALVMAVESWLGSQVSTPTESSEPYKFSILPCDLNDPSISPVALDATNGVGSLAGYLGYRAASIFGISEYPEKCAENIGKLEALSYFDGCGSKAAMNLRFFDQIGNENAADKLYDMALCKDDNSHYDFETVDNLKLFKETPQVKRHPVLKESGETLQFGHVDTDDDTSLIRSRLDNWDIKKYFDFEGADSNSYFKLTKNSDANFLYKIPTTGIVKMIGDSSITNENYKNKEMFNVCYGDMYGNGGDYYTKFVEVYNTLTKGEFVLHGYKGNVDVSDLINSKWKIKQDNIFTKSSQTFIQSSYKECGIEEKSLFNSDGMINKANMPTQKDLTEKLNTKVPTYDKEKMEYNTTETFVHNPYIIIDGGTKYIYNVFGTSVYYAQNTENDETVREAAKAFMFLLSVMNGYGSAAATIIKKILENKDSYIEGIPCGMMLFIGALLYRERYISENKKDLFKIPDKYKALGLDDVPCLGNIYYGFTSKECETPYKKTVELIGDGVIDNNVKNTYIDSFIYFVKGDWKTIMESCELKEVNGNLLTSENIDDKVKNCTDAVFYADGNDMYSAKGVFGNFNEKYSFIKKTPYGFYLYLSEANPAQTTLKSVFMNYIVIANTGANLSTAKKTVTVSKSVFKSYLNGFVNQLQDIKNTEVTSTDTKETDTSSDNKEGDIDIKLETYNNCRNIWERWLVSNPRPSQGWGKKEPPISNTSSIKGMYNAYKNSLDVDKNTNENMDFSVRHFMNNTFFLDSMFRNVYKNLHINCEILLQAIDNSAEKMVFQFLADIANNHHCHFFAFPDYLGFGGQHSDSDRMYDAMQTIFQPKPFSKIGNFDSMNKLFVMYTYHPSETASEKNSYKCDSFDLYSYDENRIMDTFKRDAIGTTASQRREGESDEEYEDRIRMTRYGYHIPSFGVTFGRQNNHIFKNVSPSMTNPIQTEQSINAMSAIAQKGKGSAGHSVVFHGQDLWNIYSGYSYNCRVDMMGNAQIMPLMYFQLLNIPMFRGAYMIFKVSHSMRPGDMTTSIEGMKMSRYTLPWCEEWFTDVYFDKDGNIISKEEYYNLQNCGEDDLDVGTQYFAAKKSEKALEINDGKPLGSTKKDYTETEAYSKTIIAVVHVRTGKDKEAYALLRVHKKVANTVVKIFNEIYAKCPDFYFSIDRAETKQYNEAKVLSDAESEKIGKIQTGTFYSYSYRNISGKGCLSNHAYGVAIDINPANNPYTKNASELSKAYNKNKSLRKTSDDVVKIFYDNGWGWGGTYYDFMHFSYFNGS